MIVYRIEHKDTKLGPFTHGGQIPEVINKGLFANTTLMEDIDCIPEVVNLIQKGALFAFTTEGHARAIVKDWGTLSAHGFVMASYDITPLFIHVDGQVLFFRE